MQNFVSAVVTRLLPILALLVGTGAAQAVELTRNGVAYQVGVTLPEGASFTHSGIDRQFAMQGVRGNLRLIQDRYDECASLLAERIENKATEGFLTRSDEASSPTECSVTLTDEVLGLSVSSAYLRIDACDCFAAIHFTYAADRAQSYRDVARPILASLRANNRKAEPAADGIGQLLGSLDRLTCEGLPRQRDEAGPMLILLSAYTGETVRSLGTAAGFADLADDILENYGLSDLDADRRDAIMNGIIAAHPTVVRAVAQDVDRYGDQLCLVLADPEQSAIHTLVERQQDFRSTYHPLYLKAQKLLYLHGCTDPDHDGAFGPMTAAAWGALAQATGLPAPEGRPTPGDVAAAATRPMAAGACDSDAFAGAETIIALDFLDRNDSGWLQSLTPERVDLFDRLGRASDWTRFGERLAESVFNSYGLTPARKRAMLADIYADGIGVSRSDAAALHWRRLAADSPEPYQLYQATRSNPGLAVTAARAAIRSEADRDREFGDENGEIYRQAAGPLAIDGRTAVSVAELADLARLAELAQDDPEAARLLLEEGSVRLANKLADRLLEGATQSGRDPELAARFLASAADRGDSFATSRLAFLHRHGLGVAQDLELARRMAERAAEAGEPFAAYQLAVSLDAEGADARRTIALYGQALAPLNEGGTPNDDIRSLVVNRIVASSGALASPPGRTLLDEQAADDPFLARALADAYLCTECGGPVDVAEAATWLRRAADANDEGQAYRLATLLRARPALESKPGEAAERLAANVTPAENGDGALFGYDTHLASYLTLAMDRADPARFASDMAEILDVICGELNGRCNEAAGLFASGRLDVRLIAQGIERLERLGSPSLIDIRASYGDFEGALALARQAADDGTLDVVVGDDLDGVSTERDSTLRRLFAQRSGGALKSLPPALEPFLRILARNGDETAEAYLDMMFELPQEPAPIRRDTALAAQTYETVAARGGLSRALVNAAREYSLALTADGAAEPALRFELAALSAELALDDVAALTSSPIQNGLTRVCHLSRASERAFDLGAPDVAMVLAKDAVNTLQRIRSDLSAVPERLQTCFRDLVADNYRWLADLLIRQNRLSEAEFVMGLLKDFEAFQFVERDPAFVGRSYEELPYSDDEETLRQALQALVPPTVEDARRSDALRTRRALEGLNADEARELAAIEDRLNAADAAFERGLDDIIAAAETLGRGDRATRLSDLGPLQGYMQTEIEENAAAIHFVVLPDRLSAILTTRTDRRSHTVTSWQGEPFRETVLNAEIDAFLQALNAPRGDPRAQGRKLHDLLIGPFAADLDGLDVDLLLVSLDRRLRYLPFAALHDGKGFLVERFDVSVLSDAGFEIAGDRVTGIPFAGLGMTRAAAGFSALPGVRIELEGILRQGDGQGLFDGRVRFDDEFDRTALEDALRIGSAGTAGVGVVHVSSHFALGETDATSFLLLGTGERLPLADIKANRRAFEFGRVDLLTLSACQTGFASPARDGRELESLARITGDRGAKAILASLWPVADNTTAIMMQRFYELRDRGGYSKAHALGLVQREFISDDIGSTTNWAGKSIVFETAERGAVSLKTNGTQANALGLGHPFYWAPFILTGNWR